VAIRQRQGQPDDAGLKGEPPFWRQIGVLRRNSGGPKLQSLPYALPLFYIYFEVTKLKKKNKIRIKNTSAPKNSSKKWIVIITVLSFFLSVSMNMLSSTLMPMANIVAALFLLLALILIGVVFDIIGIAVTTADETPFHSMASRRVRAASQAIWLIRNAEKVSNVCNDVIGDIVGIISGAATTAIVTKILNVYNFDGIVVSLLLTGLVASLTIGGKAMGKGVAMSKANSIIYTVARIINIFNFNKRKKS